MVCVVDGVTDCYFSIQMGSGLMAHKASRVISLLNACLSHDSNQKIKANEIRQVPDLNMGKLSLDLLCPPDMRGALLRDRGDEHIAPAKILVFPASDISKYLTSINYPSDGRHYGPAMYIPFMRSLQGIAHEFHVRITGENNLEEEKWWKNKGDVCRRYYHSTINPQKKGAA
jgi:hypothetical protein